MNRVVYCLQQNSPCRGSAITFLGVVFAPFLVILPSRIRVLRGKAVIAFLSVPGAPGGEALYQLRDNSCAIRRRMAASGRRPTPAFRLSSRCATREVPGIAQVTAGWEMIHLRKNCAQLAQSISTAQGGRSLPFTRRKRLPSANGRL